MKSTIYDAINDAGVATPTAHPASRLSAAHFAFMRALLQGVEPQICWRQYLGSDDKPGAALDIRRAIDEIRNAFAVASKQHRRPGTARLVMLNLSVVAQNDITAPPLADFVAAQMLDGFSEAEQLVFFAQQFGAQNRKQTRVLARQLEAVNWLQRVALAPTAWQEQISDWLEPALADRLARGGIERTAQLRQLMAWRASRWWYGIRGIGAIKAARVAAAMPSLPQESHRSALNACAWPPPEFSDCSVATADLEAVQRWLHAVADQHGGRSRKALKQPVPPVIAPDIAGVGASLARHRYPSRPDRLSAVAGGTDRPSNTQRAYWKEAQRFLLWLARERHRTLANLTPQDCSAYVRFLEAPDARWCGPRGRGRDDPLWRPFEGPLGPPGRSHAVSALRSLYRFLLSQGELTASPWESGAAAPVARIRPRQAAAQGVDSAAWAIIDGTLVRLAPTSANARLRVAIHLLHATGAGLGELVRASVDDLEAPARARQSWLLHRRGAGGRLAPVVLHADAVRLLQEYFVARGLNASLLAPENRGARLLGKATDAPQRAPWAPCAREPVDRRGGIGLGTMADQLRAFFQLCAQACADRPALARRFEAANSHWLRSGPAAPQAGRQPYDPA